MLKFRCCRGLKIDTTKVKYQNYTNANRYLTMVSRSKSIPEWNLKASCWIKKSIPFYVVSKFWYLYLWYWKFQHYILWLIFLVSNSIKNTSYMWYWNFDTFTCVIKPSMFNLILLFLLEKQIGFNKGGRNWPWRPKIWLYPSLHLSIQTSKIWL